MIQIHGVIKIGTEQPQQFQLTYKDLEKENQKGYLLTTKYGTEEQLRDVLASCDVPEGEIDGYFARAQRIDQS